MTTTLHFIDVGQGNMTLIQTHKGKVILYDCNVTTDNERPVLGYLANALGRGTGIDVFVNSHRDADHMRGVKKVHARHPIKTFWDTGVTGTTPSSTEYGEYMELRRQVGYSEPKPMTRYDYGYTRIRVLNAKNDGLANNPNAQSIVIKVCEMDGNMASELCSAMLCGDTDAATWKDIANRYMPAELSCDILLASHHGSITYFDDPADTQHYYTSHIEHKSPDVTIISTGPNNYGHPHKKALEFYNRNSRGGSKGTKICRTDNHKTIRVDFDNAGKWSMKWGL